jgi:hypothetical protein
LELPHWKPLALLRHTNNNLKKNAHSKCSSFSSMTKPTSQKPVAYSHHFSCSHSPWLEPEKGHNAAIFICPRMASVCSQMVHSCIWPQGLGGSSLGSAKPPTRVSTGGSPVCSGSSGPKTNVPERSQFWEAACSVYLPDLMCDSLEVTWCLYYLLRPS